MNHFKRTIIAAAILLCFAHRGMAQVFVERIPEAPRYEQATAPGPKHIWIGDDWQSKEGKYEFTGGKWVEPPQPGQRWIPGHWKERKKGWMWIPGHWR